MTTKGVSMRARILRVLIGWFVVSAALTVPAAADGDTVPVAPPAIRLGDVPDTHPAFLYDDGETLWWCATDLDDEYTVCETAVWYPAGSFGF